MQTLSYWEQTAFFDEIDIAIIGSGIVGLNAAIHLRQLAPKARIAILERGSLPSGASTRNAGFACFGSPSELLSDLRHHGEHATWALVERRWKGLLALRQLLGDAAIGWEQHGGYELFLPGEESTYAACREQLATCNTAFREITGTALAFRTADEKISALGLGNTAHLLECGIEGQIDTGRMMRNLIACARANGIEIYNGIGVQRLEEQADGVEVLTTENWRLRAGKVLVATNGFARRLLPELAVRPARNQVLVTHPLPDLPLQGCFHYQEGYVYFRNIGNRLLIGGFRHLDPEGETTDDFGFSPIIQNALEGFLREVVLPGRAWSVAQKWSGILGVGESKAPIIQSISPHIHVAVRLGGMGIAIGTLVGREAAESLLQS